MINESNKIFEETNLQKIGNLIKIPYYDLIEEAKNQPSFYINGYPLIELDETNQDLYEDDEILDIETKKGFQLKRKANAIENYYKNYSDDELSSVHCSKCFMNGFHKNELLYFKDRKSLISYLKYCFIFLKKNLFTNHTIYMNNRYDLLKIDNTYFIGFHFLIPKTICKSCFIQLINKEFLLSKLKTEISDIDEDATPRMPSPKKNNILLQKKRNIKRKKPENNSEEKNKNEKNENQKIQSDLKSIQISPIIIPKSNPDTPKKKIRRRNLMRFTRRKIRRKNNKINNKIINKYNNNVIYDETNHILIISKKINPEEKRSDSPEKKQIDIVVEEPKISKEKIKEEIIKVEEDNKQKKVDIPKIKNENAMDNDSNIKIEKKEKIVENKEKEPPIINKINNIKEVKENKDTREIINMMNKPNNLLKKNINNNIINNNNNNVLIKKEFFFAIDQFINQNFFLNRQKIIENSKQFLICFEKLRLVSEKVLNSMNDNSIYGMLFGLKNHIILFFRELEDINEKINENYILMLYSFYTTKKKFQIYAQINPINEQKLQYREFLSFKQSIESVQDYYKLVIRLCYQGLCHFAQTIEDMINTYSACCGNVQNA